MKSDMEDKEWLDDSMSLKQVNPNNPFTVPAGYFDGLEQRITSYIHLDELKTSAPEGFVVPKNYFDELSANIQSRIAIDKLTGADEPGFTVPENYFDELSANIQSRIAIDELTGADEHNFAVPENYFDELSANIQGRIAVDELVNADEHGFAVPENYFDDLQDQITARILVEQTLGETEETFTVPADYFDQLNKRILNNTVNQDIVRRKGIVRKMLTSGSFKYAAAACFALVIGTGIFVKQVTDPIAEHNSSFLHQQISTLPVSDIQSYLQQDVDANDTQHAVIDEGAPVNDNGLNNALQDLKEATQ